MPIGLKLMTLNANSLLSLRNFLAAPAAPVVFQNQMNTIAQNDTGASQSSCLLHTKQVAGAAVSALCFSAILYNGGGIIMKSSLAHSSSKERGHFLIQISCSKYQHYEETGKMYKRISFPYNFYSHGKKIKLKMADVLVHK